MTTTGECLRCGNQMLGRAPSFCYQQCFWFCPNFTFLLPPFFGLLEPAQIFATIDVLVLLVPTPNFVFCYNQCFGLLETTPIFATMRRFGFAGTDAKFCNLLQPVFWFAGASPNFCYNCRFCFAGKNAQFCIFASNGVLVCWNQL